MNMETKLTELLDSGVKTALVTGARGIGKGDFVRRYARSHGTAVCYPWYQPRNVWEGIRLQPELPACAEHEDECRDRPQTFAEFCARRAGSAAACGCGAASAGGPPMEMGAAQFIQSVTEKATCRSSAA